MITNKILFTTLGFFLAFVSIAQTKSQKLEITKNYNKVELAKMAEEFNTQQTQDLEKALELAKKHNWPITYTDKNGSYHALIKVSSTNQPIYYKTFNKNAAKSSRANFLHNGGGLGLNIEGQGMTAHVWDGGVARDTHQEFSDTGGGPTRITLGDPSASADDHATHVIGTVIAYGANTNAKGMAPQASVVSYDWFGDKTEATIEAGNGMLVSNHSYGSNINDLNDWQIGAYTMDSRGWDKIMYQAPYYLMVCSAGNDGDNNYANGDPMEGNSNFDKLYDQSVSKNTMVVASGFDLSIDTNGEIVGSISRNSFSSEGPTDDYRIKPDIMGNGSGLYSSTSTTNSSYASYSGTSMSAPNVTGSLLLLQQLYYEENGNFMLSSTLRGLALHNADDGGIVGPDSQFGWGYLNTKKAAECIINDGTTAEVEELILNDGESYSIQVTADGTNPLIASICWTDEQSNNVNTGTPNDPTPVLVNDLDIRLTQSGTDYEPWKLTGVYSNTQGDNDVDNIERVDITNASGIYTLTVTHKGTLDNSQAYSLILSGINGTNIGVEENNLSNFKIWPNPNYGKFNIFVEDLGKIDLTIYDLLGRKVLKESYQNTVDNVKTINLANYQKGIYLVSIDINGKTSTNKLVIE